MKQRYRKVQTEKNLNPLNSSSFKSQSIFPSLVMSHFSPNNCVKLFLIIGKFQTLKVLSGLCRISLICQFYNGISPKCSTFRCNVCSLHFLMLPRFPEMKIQRLATNNLDALVFPVNNTTEQLDEDQVGIALPPEVLKGKG